MAAETNFWILLCVTTSTAYALDIVGCGGFIKSSVPLNFSKIQVKLFTESTRALRYKTDCAPGNGYYLVPLYDKGDYVLTVDPPEGWAFEPSEVVLHVDGANDPCSLQQDVNFEFLGFSVYGTVVSQGEEDGPTGVALTLRDDGGKVVKETASLQGQSFVTDEDLRSRNIVHVNYCITSYRVLQAAVMRVSALYQFNNLLTGKYSVSASHPTWDVAKEPIRFEVTQDSVTLDSPIVVYGYDVKGAVKDKDVSVEGVQFFLSRHNSQQFPCGTERKVSAKCEVSSGADGSFVFYSVPVGQYTLSPLFTRGGVVFKVAPSALPLTVGYGSVVVEQVFEVQGFQVKGRIIMPRKGASGQRAKVYIDGVLKAESDADGKYELSDMSTGKCRVTVELADVEFVPTDVDISTSSPNLPDIAPSKYAACGMVSITVTDSKEAPLSAAGRKVTATEASSEVQVVSTTTNEQGHFCFSLQPGAYSINVGVTEMEASNGVLFQPASFTVHVTNAVEKDIQFTQFVTSIKGTVTCIESCPKTLAITMERTAAQLERKSQRKPTAATIESGLLKFEFSNVLAGRHNISISAPNWCWSQHSVQLDVDPKLDATVSFKQSGFYVSVTSSHNTSLVLTLSSDPKVTQEVAIESGVTGFCVEKAGRYTGKVSEDSCHEFEQSSFVYNTDSPEPIALSAVRHRVEASVEVPAESDAQDITLRIRSQFYPEVEPEVMLSPVSVQKANDTAAPKLLLFKHMARTSDRLEIVPLSAVLMFSPGKAFHDVSINCPQVVPSFIGNQGMVVTGTVIPPLKGVSVQIVSDDGARQLAETDESGHYTAGPFMNGSKLELTATLDGYSLQQLEKDQFSFLAVALSRVQVKVVDADGGPLPGALVSLSGTNFRSNSLTNSNGELTFADLAQGQYHIRPFYREYDFEPSTKDVSVTDGSAEEVQFVGHRTAFSCLGRVQSLNGQGVGGVTVKLSAVPDENCVDLSDHVVTDDTGKYRLSGLVPNCNYLLTIGHNSVSAQAIPPEQRVTGSSADVSDVNFFVMPTANKMEVTGFVATNSQFLSSLQVSLSETGSSGLFYSVGLDSSGFFYFSPIAFKENVTYNLSVETVLSRSSYLYSLPSVQLKSFVGMRHFLLDFTPKEVHVHKKRSRVAQVVVCAIVAASFLLLGLSKAFGLSLTNARTLLVSRFSAASADQTRTPKKKQRK